nr:hypothetical protein [uncultured Desulfobacter sp.]
MMNLAVQTCGIICHAGLTAPAACAAIRCGLNNFSETRFMDGNGEWIVAAEVPLETPFRGRTKLIHMAAMAIQEALSNLTEDEIRTTSLILCLPEMDRPGRMTDIDQSLLQEIEEVTGFQFAGSSTLIAEGRVGGVTAIKLAHELMHAGKTSRVLIAGTDSYVTAATLAAFEKEDRILTGKNSNGFISGEAAAAVLLVPAQSARNAAITIKGIGFGSEQAHIRSEHPQRAQGMVQAVKAALSMAECELGDLDYRICDVSGEQYYFKEAALVLSRILRKRKEEFDIWHPAECIGETGAAILPVILAVASAAAAKGYAKGNGVLCHFSNDNGQRAAIVVQAKTE